MFSHYDREQNIVGKGENADYHDFLLFLQFFRKPVLLELLKAVIVLETHNAEFYDLEKKAN